MVSFVLYVFPVGTTFAVHHLHVTPKCCHYFLTINAPTAEVLGPHVRRLLHTFIWDTAGNFEHAGTSEDLHLHAEWTVSQTLLLLSLSCQQPNSSDAVCCCHSLFWFFLFLFFSHTRPHVCWPTSEEHLVTQIRLPRPEGLCTACW